MKLDGGLQTPFLVIRVDRVRSNLERMQTLLAERGGLARWRPHTKTAKVPAVLRMLIDAGVRRFKTATTRETAVLLDVAEDADVSLDVLVAMTLRGANLERAAELARAFERHDLAVLTEDPEHAREVQQLDERLDLFVDLDPRFGRSGIPLDDERRIAATIAACGDALAGLHAYEGHVRARTDVERARECQPLYDALLEIVDRHQLGELEVITSGTPTFEQALDHDGLARLDHTISPGIVVYWDRNSESLGIEGFAFAASTFARVISAPSHDRVTLDAGSKSLDAAAGDPCVEVVGWPNLAAQRPSEEHLPLVARHGRAPRVGELVELLPRHVCPMINLADEAVLVDGHEIVEVAPVSARGHELRGG